MSHFSERNQLAPTKPIQVADIDVPLFNRIWNIFYNREHATSRSSLSFKSQPGKTEQILDALGYGYTYPDNYFDRNKNKTPLLHSVHRIVRYTFSFRI